MPSETKKNCFNPGPPPKMAKIEYVDLCEDDDEVSTKREPTVSPPPTIIPSVQIIDTEVVYKRYNIFY